MCMCVCVFMCVNCLVVCHGQVAEAVRCNTVNGAMDALKAVDLLQLAVALVPRAVLHDCLAQAVAAAEARLERKVGRVAAGLCDACSASTHARTP